LRMFQNAHFALESFSEQSSTALIHSHFAQLGGTKRDFTLMNDGCIEGAFTPWQASSVFPDVASDILLYLLLMGGLKYSAFLTTSGPPVPYSHFLLSSKANIDYRSKILDLSNAAQKSNDGMFLETILSATVCLASHHNGVAGVQFGPFLMILLYHLQVETVDPQSCYIKGIETLTGMKEYTIPFLSPPNQVWPEYLSKVPQFNFGSLERTKNAEKIDLRASNGLYGESKDYGNVIKLPTMKKILSRVPSDTKLELVFTRKLQESYFKRSKSSFAEEFARCKCSFFKIDASKPQTSLEAIEGLPNHLSASSVVLFLKVNEKLKLD
jgi:hypothetical protein